MHYQSFDTIVIDSGNGFHPIEPDDWKAISPVERVDLILKQAVRFLKNEQIVSSRDALAEINGRSE